VKKDDAMEGEEEKQLKVINYEIIPEQCVVRSS
jgi:hypothetical protein